MSTIEPSVDLFGLGATFYDLLAGKRSYFEARRGGNLPDLRQHAPTVTAPFADLIARLTHLDPQQRPSALQTKEELLRIGRNIGIRMG